MIEVLKCEHACSFLRLQCINILHYIARIEPQLVNHTSGVFTLRMCTRMHRLGACWYWKRELYTLVKHQQRGRWTKHQVPRRCTHARLWWRVLTYTNLGQLQPPLCWPWKYWRRKGNWRRRRIAPSTTTCFACWLAFMDAVRTPVAVTVVTVCQGMSRWLARYRTTRIRGLWGRQIATKVVKKSF